MVEDSLTSALILEDDADWDVRIKTQLQDFALSARALLQPLAGGPRSFADPTFENPESTDGMMPADILFHQLPATLPPAVSPYGDGWDVLWLGHCGTEFPNTSLPAPAASPLRAALSRRLPRGRVVHLGDDTVPANDHLHFLSDEDDPRLSYPAHTRITHHVLGSVCSLAYAVSQRGARRLLYELGVRKFDGAFDVMLRDTCDGSNARHRGVCLTVQPQLFNHHRPAGHASSYSDISEHPEKINELPHTEMIRWSARLNLWNSIQGSGYDDQFGG